MPSIRRTIFAALWGVPGPVIVGSAIALAFGTLAAINAGGRLSLMEVVENAASFWLIPLLNVVAGAGYGLMRSGWSPFAFRWPPPGPRNGAALGAFLWALFGLPFLVCSWLVVALLMITFGGRLAEGYWLDEFAPELAAYLGHVCGGAIAGFHVEYYLLRARD